MNACKFLLRPKLFERSGLLVIESQGERNGESDRARLDFDVSGFTVRLDKFDVAELRRALTKWAKEHPKNGRLS